ncbi:stalk domain-containing protein [Abyssisolibacter fermentans]|uniref:stalk domain-containing protein n=1 Tax=Abyssisolibacter fermentans TaxID=1766203 RepID=UPI00082C74CA|nr:stalk domain-containing protein [Abyssisolibacter fermentans]
MKKYLKGVLTGIVITLLLGSSLGFAQGVKQTIEVLFNSINLEVNKQKITCDNILYNGTTYVPIRKVAEILGKKVEWNGETNTASINDIQLNNLDNKNDNMSKIDNIENYYAINEKNFNKIFLVNLINKDLGKLKDYVDVLGENCEEYVNKSTHNNNLEYIVLKGNEFYNSGRFHKIDGLTRGTFVYDIEGVDYKPLYEYFKKIIKKIYGTPNVKDEKQVFSENKYLYVTFWNNITLQYSKFDNSTSEIRLFILPSDENIENEESKENEEVSNKSNLINVTLKRKIKGSKDLKEYLEEYYSKLYTPTGKWIFTFDISENDSELFPYDYLIRIDWYNSDDVLPYDLEYSIKISEDDKEKTKELLTQFQKEIASVSMQALPNKKLIGEFYSDFYKYPNIKVGYNSINFLKWYNYNNTHSNYNSAEITKFHWENNDINYDFLRESDDSISIEENNNEQEKNIHKSDWEKSPSETTGHDWIDLTVKQKEQLIEDAIDELQNKGYTIKKDIDWFYNEVENLYNEDKSRRTLNVTAIVSIKSLVYKD